jgi:hypothetical protein
MFTKRLREGVRRGEITCSVRIWARPHVRVGARYRMEEGEIQVDSIQPIDKSQHSIPRALSASIKTRRFHALPLKSFSQTLGSKMCCKLTAPEIRSMRVNIKVTLRSGDIVTIPSHGESAKSWLNNVRRSGSTHLICDLCLRFLEAVCVWRFRHKPDICRTFTSLVR